MALAEVGNLATNLVNQLLGQGRNSSSNAPAVQSGATNTARNLPEDRFTPSAQGNSNHTTAQEAGLFQVAQFSTLSAAANITQNQAATQAAQNPASAQAAQAVATPAALQGPVAQVAAPTNTVTAAANVQDQLQTLNLALAALGLNDSDIQSLDRVASLIKDFSPLAYSSLVYQLEALAQQTAPRAASAATNAVTATSGANAGTFQIQGLAIHFSGAQGSSNRGTSNGNSSGQQAAGGGTPQFSAFNLQVEEVQLTLTNSNGQTVQVHAPQQNILTSSGAQPTIQTKAATA